MEGQFHREQQILDNAYRYINGLRNGLPIDNSIFEMLTEEYDILLKQMKQIIRISDKASLGLLNDKRSKQELITELENELLQSQISIMLSQIQPHFIYNSLNAIKGLCHIDPEAASETIDEFSDYLRGNLDSLMISKPVTFERELRHIKLYLSLEKKRFGDKLKIVYDIGTDNFQIPALSLQPVVENAVRHGVTKREEGGTVTIKTEDTETDVIITVIDDGIGFDSGKPERDERIHVGLANVKKRLSAMCGGSLCINSKPGFGTKVVIILPKEGV